MSPAASGATRPNQATDDQLDRAILKPVVLAKSMDQQLQRKVETLDSQ
jgi:hypothetical protein